MEKTLEISYFVPDTELGPVAVCNLSKAPQTSGYTDLEPWFDGYDKLRFEDGTLLAFHEVRSFVGSVKVVLCLTETPPSHIVTPATAHLE